MTKSRGLLNYGYVDQAHLKPRKGSLATIATLPSLGASELPRHHVFVLQTLSDLSRAGLWPCMRQIEFTLIAEPIVHLIDNAIITGHTKKPGDQVNQLVCVCVYLK